MDDIKKILIYRTDRYGDFLISAPFVYSLKKKYPKSQIHIMCSAYNENLIKNFTFVDKTMVFKDGFFSRFQMIFSYFNKKYNLIIVLDGKRRSLYHSLFLKGKRYCLIKNYFLIKFCSFFKINYVINSESQTQFKNIAYLSNLIGFNLIKNNVFENYQFPKFKLNLPKKYIVFHLDEKWFIKTYYFDYTDINPSTASILKILNFILKNKNIKIVLTTGYIKLPIIDFLKKYIYKKKHLNNNIFIIENSSFNEIQYIISKSKALICCEGGVSHVSYFFNKSTLALYEGDRKNFHNFWTGHMNKLVAHHREDIKILSKSNSLFYKKILKTLG